MPLHSTGVQWSAPWQGHAWLIARSPLPGKYELKEIILPRKGKIRSNTRMDCGFLIYVLIVLNLQFFFVVNVGKILLLECMDHSLEWLRSRLRTIFFAASNLVGCLPDEFQSTLDFYIETGMVSKVHFFSWASCACQVLLSLHLDYFTSFLAKLDIWIGNTNLYVLWTHLDMVLMSQRWNLDEILIILESSWNWGESRQ